MLDGLRCPNCGGQAISWWRKAWLGTIGTVTCRVCNEQLRVSQRHAFVVLVPFVLVLVGANLVLVYRWPFWIAATVIAVAVYIAWVPLVSYPQS